MCQSKNFPTSPKLLMTSTTFCDLILNNLSLMMMGSCRPAQKHALHQHAVSELQCLQEPKPLHQMLSSRRMSSLRCVAAGSGWVCICARSTCVELYSKCDDLNIIIICMPLSASWQHSSEPTDVKSTRMVSKMVSKSQRCQVWPTSKVIFPIQICEYPAALA